MRLPRFIAVTRKRELTVVMHKIDSVTGISMDDGLQIYNLVRKVPSLVSEPETAEPYHEKVPLRTIYAGAAAHFRGFAARPTNG
jgi:tetraacyldisaccharide-1-P 4'-kinase